LVRLPQLFYVDSSATSIPFIVSVSYQLELNTEAGFELSIRRGFYIFNGFQGMAGFFFCRDCAKRH
jgi:hypothetical protein